LLEKGRIDLLFEVGEIQDVDGSNQYGIVDLPAVLLDLFQLLEGAGVGEDLVDAVLRLFLLLEVLVFAGDVGVPPGEVAGHLEAAATALGILVPPGRRTVVILRPRGLPWDSLFVEQGQATAIAQLGREEAAATARALFHALESWAGGGLGRMVALALPDDRGF